MIFVRVNTYLGLELHHVCFYFHVGFVQFFYFMIQMLNIIFVFNTWVRGDSLIYHVPAEITDFFYFIHSLGFFVPVYVSLIEKNLPCHTKCQSSLPLLALNLIVIISSSEYFFLIFCAFSGQPDKLVQQAINDNFTQEKITETTKL